VRISVSDLPRIGKIRERGGMLEARGMARVEAMGIIIVRHGEREIKKRQEKRHRETKRQ
jgi:hypothetical protein